MCVKALLDYQMRRQVARAFRLKIVDKAPERSRDLEHVPSLLKKKNAKLA
jgi:hypothetical protein